MTEESISIPAIRKRELRPLAALFGELGFSKISYSKEVLSLEKLKGRDLKGNPFLEYSTNFQPNEIVFKYSVPPEKNRTARLVELLPTFLNVVRLAEDYYEVKPSAVFSQVNTVLKEVSKMVGKDVTELSIELNELKARHAELTAKYEDLVQSGEKNTHLLLECERKRDELSKRAKSLESMGNELLKEELYEWIRIHGGTIDVSEFSKAKMVPPQRVEEGLNLLIREGYIKRRML